tara:strand:+ start:465 stop:1094 length:630 start_codon:yes stop_codon:yes gene_type:complete
MTDNIKKIVFFENRNAPQKTTSRWREAYPAFAKLCFEDEEISLALRYAFSWSQFFLEYLARDLNTSGKFFTKSPAHQIYYYIMLKTLTDSVLFRQSDQVGTKHQDAIREMKRMGISEPSARSIIAESVDAGYVVETFWRQDQRVKMLFLTTEMMKSWLEHCAFLMFDFIKEANLPEMREEIEAAGEGFFERVLQKIETSMQQDQQLSQK